MSEWYEEFKEWYTAHPEKKDQLDEVYNQRSLRRLMRGEQSLTSIPEGKRMHLFDITNLECFKVDGQHPKELDIEKVRTGAQPRSLISRRAEYEGMTKKDLLARLPGISESVFFKYLRGDTIEPVNLREIEKRLASFYSGEYTAKEPSVYTDKRREHTLPRTSSGAGILNALEGIRNELGRVALQVAQKSPDAIAAEILDRQFDTDLESRIGAVNTAIDVLAHQMDYFREASQEEREKLAKTIDVNLLGYVTALLPRINQPKSVETVLRLVSPDQISPRRKS
ncbi:hypothetical protein HYZ97_03140 [Candidatus Pacearchaeota archaeon]|nr:hypothetical protein [Candidatus Pacearchaeota archaeon]